MAPTTPVNHDPALSHTSPAAPASQPPQGLSQNIASADIPGLQLDQQQIIHLLRSLPGVFTKLAEGQVKEDAAQALSNLAQGSSPFGTPHIPLQYPAPTGLPGINDPGPSSHPRGPPNLGQLSAVAMQAAPVNVQPQQQQPMPEDGPPDQGQNTSTSSVEKDDSGSPSASPGTSTIISGGRRGARSATMGTDEWSRQRKDNHKEVERRRRGNINEGINELGRLVPNGSGEKAKGAILSRAVQYIHHLKENEARNIEKWTLEKLLMDQAMGDLQAQLEEVKRRWEEESMLRSRAEAELEALRNISGNVPVPVLKEDGVVGTKRRSAEGSEGSGNPQVTEGGERDGKRQRTD